MKVYLFALAVTLLASCLYMYKPPDILASPSGLYELETKINHDKKNARYGCVILTLLDSSFKKIDTLQTGASDYMRWNICWYPGRDTIILASKDIGTYAYHIGNDRKLDTIHITDKIKNIAVSILKRKYRND